MAQAGECQSNSVWTGPRCDVKIGVDPMQGVWPAALPNVLNLGHVLNLGDYPLMARKLDIRRRERNSLQPVRPT